MKTKIIVIPSLFLILLSLKNENTSKTLSGGTKRTDRIHVKEHFFLKNENFFMYKIKKID